MTAIQGEQLTKKKPEKALTGFHSAPAEEITTVDKPFVFVAVGISGCIVRLISAVTRLVFRPRWRRLNMIQIGQRELPCCIMRMVKSDTFWRRSALWLARACEAGAGAEVRPGNALPLLNMPLGTTIHNIELKPGKGGQLDTQCRRIGPGDGS